MTMSTQNGSVRKGTGSVSVRALFEQGEARMEI